MFLNKSHFELKHKIEPTLNLPKKQRKIVQFGHRYHTPMMYILYDDGTIYYGDPEKNISWTKIDVPL